MSDGRRSQAAFAGLTILVNHEEEGWERRLGPRAEPLVRGAVEAAATHAGLPLTVATELGVTLADDAAVKALNAEWRGKDKPTNILSFPASRRAPGEAPGPLLGDLVLAFQTCEREAGEEGKPFEDHFTHLIVHGFLHLLGHDHEDEDSAERMEGMEIAILADLRIPDPYRAAGEEQPRETTNPEQERR